MSCETYKESKQAGVCQNFICHKFLIRNTLKFSSSKNLCYMVCCIEAVSVNEVVCDKYSQSSYVEFDRQHYIRMTEASKQYGTLKYPKYYQ